MNGHETISGTTVLTRIGYSHHGGKQFAPYFPPKAVIAEHLDFAAHHGGRVLWVYSMQNSSSLKDIDHIILWALKTDLMLIGDVAASGKYYDPEEWDDESYRRPKPWNVMPGRFWFALDNVRQFKGLAPADYTYVTETEKKPLSEVNYRNGRIPVARIIPKEGAD